MARFIPPSDRAGVEAALSSGRAAWRRWSPVRTTPSNPASPKKSSKNNQLYFTQSVRSRLEKCSSRGSLTCVENSSASRTGETVLLPPDLEYSPEIAPRLCASIPEQNISQLALPLSVSCLVFSVYRLPASPLAAPKRRAKAGHPNTPFGNLRETERKCKNRQFSFG